MSHLSFKDLRQPSLDPHHSTREALDNIKLKLCKWNKDVVGNIQMRKRICKVVSSRNMNQSVLDQEAMLEKELELILEQEEVLWLQKSREKWIKLGDRNTQFFDMPTIIRRWLNRVLFVVKMGRGKLIRSNLKTLRLRTFKSSKSSMRKRSTNLCYHLWDFCL
ncbi:LOW QUALITY PROTEIN: hypothetical protein V2J09_022373 [Rumex salicifolius]